MTRAAIGIGTVPGDGTGDNLRVAFDKTNDNFEELYGLISETINAAGFAGTNIVKIQSAINHAVAFGAERVFVPSAMLPYDASLIVFDPSVKMIREGGLENVYDVRAYGAAGNDTQDDAPSFNACRAAQVYLDGGGLIYVPGGIYKIASGLNWTGKSVVLVGESRNRSQIKPTASAFVVLTIGDLSEVDHRIEDIWIYGNATCLGGIRIGTETLTTAYTTLRRIRVNNFTGVGAYDISLERVQELNAEDVRVDASYRGWRRPNWGYVTSAHIHGQAGYIGTCTTHGVDIGGVIDDLTISNIVIEANGGNGINAEETAGVGTLTATGTGPFTGTFSVSQAGKVHNDGYVIVAGQLYIVKNFNGTTGCTLEAVNAGPNTFGASAFSYGFKAILKVTDSYFETSDKSISITGGNATYSAIQITCERNRFVNADSGVHLNFDRVARSVVARNVGLDVGGSIVTTANTQCHFEDNADQHSATDISAVYSGLLGGITTEDTDKNPSVHRFAQGVVAWVSGIYGRLASNAPSRLAYIDANDIPQLGTNDGTTVQALVKLGAFTNAALPAGGATKNYAIAFDTTNNRPVFYVNGTRIHYGAGTSF